jgi:hypothetical protein
MQIHDIQKEMDPTDPDADPEHCYVTVSFSPVRQRESSYEEAETKATAAVRERTL